MFQHSSLGVVILALLLGGCTASLKGYPQRAADVQSRLGALKQEYFDDEAVIAEFNDRSGNAKRAYRNEVIHARLYAMDLQFSIFRKAIYTESTGSSLFWDLLGIGVGGAGAVVTSEDTSRILSALSGGIAGTSVAIDKNLYYERTMPALLSLMDAQRKAVKARILTAMSQQTAAYPLVAALSDLEDYYAAGSIPGAVAGIIHAAGQKDIEANTTVAISRDELFARESAQEAVDALLDQAGRIPGGAAVDLLEQPPVPFSEQDRAMLRAFLPQGRALADLPEEESRALLKRMIVLQSDRSNDALSAWRAALTAAASEDDDSDTTN